MFLMMISLFVRSCFSFLQNKGNFISFHVYVNEAPYILEENYEENICDIFNWGDCIFTVFY